ncbi:MAG: hypothetical protein A2365_02110 [Candidatus Nealsonbacteria bacterium RIFOXYB1_FULL_40_15]|uniref:Transcription-repair coupling factor n=2 Tax=Candidatus Nealsoniibacteriota TaxID=1817911 RepID=A0A1G2EN25_9BACT|nr:MAG: hypothetical protein A2365_02110 [Candidatus Nealsonbacteria bacterium RIFOXYB1_FULL_40_15]OGZ27214.1 MAG: hypothetical protein A2427_03205 [Candidatus Nealsonbacteria bacterium RIFOXYC1_FULL_40_7]OGZ28870.1 MAG: hypothetical protein A2562_00715 [Candidatus Nealsonbacteria bacterium RIFOXYD1_FULL_39_11]
MLLMDNQKDKVLIASLAPYFLERDSFWFEKNLEKILDALKTQSFFQDNILLLEKDLSKNPYEILRKLDEMGYEKVQKVEEMGEFSSLGGIIEIFPINRRRAVRVDFLGNKVDSLEEIGEDLKDEAKSKEILRKKLKNQRIYSDIKGLKEGEYLVHLDHGIGRFAGFEKIKEDDYYVLEYDKNDKLFVPKGLERKLSRFVGFSEPRISRLSSPLWQRTKKKIKEDAFKLARALLDSEAKRKATERQPYLPDDELDAMLASSFEYMETPDQASAIEDIKRDMEKKKPMDRLVAGDVGFGKTEVALRAAMKAVKSGAMTVVLAPTTILASQHFGSFSKRLLGLPVNIALLTRLQNKKEREKITEGLKNSSIDILIGTHSILSEKTSSLLFKKDGRGLLIIDDEQRFGVKQKEKLKQMKSGIDALSLSATPIPRTLHLAMSSLKEMSIIQTPPEGRLPIKTFVLPWSRKIIKSAIEKELDRKGQVYYLYNRIESIERAKELIEEISPNAKTELIHARIPNRDLLSSLSRFQSQKADVLVSTTIIENGIDLENANTIIVDDASRLGLSQAYQLKGRVGRSDRQAFAFFLYKGKLKEKAKARLEALEEMQDLGSGYRIALRDLEIRGSGNILGKEQSGSINKVGLNLYCQMLSEAVEKMK